MYKRLFIIYSLLNFSEFAYSGIKKSIISHSSPQVHINNTLNLNLPCWTNLFNHHTGNSVHTDTAHSYYYINYEDSFSSLGLFPETQANLFIDHYNLQCNYPILGYNHSLDYTDEDLEMLWRANTAFDHSMIIPIDPQYEEAHNNFISSVRNTIENMLTNGAIPNSDLNTLINNAYALINQNGDPISLLREEILLNICHSRFADLYITDEARQLFEQLFNQLSNELA